MSLRRAVMVAVASASFLILALLLHLARSSSTSQALDETSRLSNSITTAIAELDQLMYQYMLHPHPRPVQQWRMVSEGMEGMFKALENAGGADFRVGLLRNEHLQARQLFDAIVAEANEDGTGVSSLHLRRSRLAEQMLLVSRSLVNHAVAIHRDSLHEQSRVQSRGRTITFYVLGAIVALLAWLLSYVNRNVLVRLELLRASAERAAHGHLELMLGDRRMDEIGRLSRTFDHLLQEVRMGREHVSKEAGVRANEASQRQLIDALPGLVWAAQPQGTIDTSNRSWREQFEVTPEAPGYDWTVLMHPSDLVSWQSAWSNALGNGLGFEIEFRLRRKDGWRWYLTRVAPLADDQGQLQRWVCNAVDIHHHKELENHLRNSRNQAEMLNQVGLDLVGELDVQRLTQRVTDTARVLAEGEFAALFYNVHDPDAGDRYRLHAVSGLPMEVFSEFGMPQATELFSPTFTGQGVVRCDDVRLDPRFSKDAPHYGLPSGHPPVVSYVAVPVRTRYGTVFGVLFCGHSQPGQFMVQHERMLLGIAALAATAFDSARLIEAERQQRRLADHRSTELARSNAELEQFAYICSHDLQEPLRMVSSFLGLLRDRYGERLDDRGLGFIQRAVEGSNRMQNLIRDILAFSRVGRGEHAEEVFGLSDVVQTAMANLQVSIEQNHAKIEVGEMPRVRANRLQCTQLMQNLISNALKFHGAAPPIIRISAQAEDHRWRIKVTDNGIGIDPAQHQRIFQVFQRLHGRDQFEGTGIGLSLCQKIVLAHGGTIGVDSQPGHGATFWFTLPDASADGDHTPQSGHHPIISVATGAPS